MRIKINKTIIDNKSKTYFIADIGANHEGSIQRAKKLIKLAAISGADAAKFQHFKADTIVNKSEFNKRKKTAHQSKWKSSVYDVYKNASINNNWNKSLQDECKKYQIDFLTSAYDLQYIDDVNKFIPAYKIGSGDITWKESLIKIAKKKKPVILATGASNINEVINAFNIIYKYNKKIILMQCNTNYTASIDNFNYINLNVLKQFKSIFKEKIILGLSDHTHGHTTVIGAVTLGAKVIEKHFTDNNSRNGPDHKFAMDPLSWRLMVEETRKLEKALGNGKKKVENNEKSSLFVQRRSVYALRKIKKGEVIKKDDLICLRPFVKNSISPIDVNKIIGKKIKIKLEKNKVLKKKWII